MMADILTKVWPFKKKKTEPRRESASRTTTAGAYTTRDDWQNSILNPLNPLSPISPINPFNLAAMTSTESHAQSSPVHASHHVEPSSGSGSWSSDDSSSSGSYDSGSSSGGYGGE